MTPEEIVARRLEREWAPLIGLPAIAELQADELLAALREAGYRIVRQQPLMRNRHRLFAGSLTDDGVFCMRAPIDDRGRVVWLDVEDGAR